MPIDRLLANIEAYAKTHRNDVMTPYLMGDTPAKFSMRPQVLSNTGAPPNSAPDYLRHVMAEQLGRESVARRHMHV